MMQLGVNTVLFGSHPFRLALELIKRCGYSGAEISALNGLGAFGNPLGEHLHLANWQADIPGIQAVVEEVGLPLTAMEVGPLDEDRVQRAFEAAAALGIPVVTIGPSGRSGSPADLDSCIERLAKLAAAAEGFGVTLCVKAHIGTAIDNTATTLEALRRIPSPAFGIDMDPSHIHRGGEVPTEALRAVLPRLRHVHIRDSGPGPAPGAAEDQASGRAEIDLLGYCRVLVEAGYAGPVNLEIIGASDYDPIRAAIIAAESYGYLNACLRASAAAARPS